MVAKAKTCVARADALQRAGNGKHGSELACNRESLMVEHSSTFQIALLADDISQIDQPVGYFSPVAEFSI